jgi:hypothetical protein
MCIPSYQLDYVFEAFNSQHPRLKLTIERKQSNFMSFLELQDENISTYWFPKETWSGGHPNISIHIFRFPTKKHSYFILEEEEGFSIIKFKIP